MQFSTLLVVIGAIVATALAPAWLQEQELREDVDALRAEGLVLEGADLANMEGSSGVSVTFDDDGTPARAILRGVRNPGGGPPERGVGGYVTIHPRVIAAVAGESLEVSVRTRATAENGSSEFLTSVLAFDQRQSRWSSFPVNAAAQGHVFTWKVPGDVTATPGAVAFVPDAEGRARGLEVLAVTLRIDDAARAPALRGDGA